MWRLLWGACLVTVLAEIALDRKGYFGVDDKFAFFAILGFTACAVMILVAKGLGFVLKREENYYGEAEEGGDPAAAREEEGGKAP